MAKAKVAMNVDHLMVDGQLGMLGQVLLAVAEECVRSDNDDVSEALIVDRFEQSHLYLPQTDIHNLWTIEKAIIESPAKGKQRWMLTERGAQLVEAISRRGQPGSQTETSSDEPKRGRVGRPPRQASLARTSPSPAQTLGES